MSRNTQALKRLGVPSLAAITLVGGLPLFMGTAQAAHVAAPTTTVLDNGSVAAGACEPFRVQLPPTGTQTTVGEDVNVVLTSTGNSATFNASFCTLPLTTGGDTFTPAAGTVVRNGGAVASGSSIDESRFATVAGATALQGEVVIGITANEPLAIGGTLSFNSYYDANDDNVFTAGEPRELLTNDVVVTAGGTTVNAAADAVAYVEVLDVGEDAPAVADADDADSAVQGETRTYTVYVANADNEDQVNGARVFYSVAGETPAVAPTLFGTTNNSGIVTGTITIPAAADAARTIQFYVNNTTGTTAAFEPLVEEGDTVALTVTPSAAQQDRTVTLTPLADGETLVNQTNPAINGAEDQDRSFRALVNAADTAGTTAGTLLAFTVTGGSGDETVTLAEAATADDAVSADPNDSTVDVIVNDPTPVVGQVLTVTATVRGSSASDTDTLTFRNAPDDARFLVLSPDPVTVAPNSAQQLTATVTDVDGKPVRGVFVTFSETGAGAFRNGSSDAGATTNAAGQATVETISLPNETGQQVVTATIFEDQTDGTLNAAVNNRIASQCAELVNAGRDPQGIAHNTTTNTAAAGDCDDTATVTFANAAPSPSATPTATTSPSATPTAPVDGPNCTPAASVNIIDTTIIATGAGRLSVDAPANSIVQLEAYTRPSTTYRVVRSAEINAAGDDAQFLITPPANTRLRARVVGCSTYGESKVMNVRTALSLFATRNGVRNYTFSGDSLPARPGGLIISLYRVTASGSQVLTSQVRANATNGEWSLTRQFTGTGRFGFVVRTGQDLQNAPGTSNVRPTLIF